jgi:hypothetical protein
MYKHAQQQTQLLEKLLAHAQEVFLGVREKDFCCHDSGALIMLC